MSIDGFDTESGDSVPDEVRAVAARARRVVRRRWRTFLLVFLLSAVTIQAVAFFWPMTFEARAAVLLQKTRLSASVDNEPADPTTVVTDSVSEQEVNSEVAILTSREVLDGTMRAVGVEKMPEPYAVGLMSSVVRAYEAARASLHGTPTPTAEQRARAGLASALAVERLRDANILNVSFRARDPQLAELVLNELLRQYLTRHVAVHSPTDVEPFFSAQAEVLHREVTSLQGHLAKLKKSAGVTDFAAEREIRLREAAALREEDLTVRRQVAELNGRVAALRRSAAQDERLTRTATTTRTTSQTDQGLRAEVLRLELEQIRLDARFTETSPLVRENRAKLEAARAALEEQRKATAEESTTGLSPTMITLRQEEARFGAEQAGASDRLAVVRGQLETATQQLSALDRRAAEADRIQLQLDSAKERYVMYLSRTEQARMSAALDRGRVANVSIVQQADAPSSPVSPRPLTTFLVSILGGLAVAWITCAWLELSAMGAERVIVAAVPNE